MKAYLIQPKYSNNINDSDMLFNKKLEMLEECGEDADIIVLPEYSDVPCAVSSYEELSYYHEKYFSTLMEKAKKTAQRCKSILFVNALDKVNEKYRNTTYMIDRNGEVIGKYYKTHIPPSEKAEGVDDSYTKDVLSPYVVEYEGVRYAFLTCYDFYFYEAFPAIALKNVDVIIGCSLQRSDTHDATETICRFLAYNTNAYVLRASVSYDENSKICGASMAVSPEGRVMLNLKGKIGVDSVEFDPHKKYLKPAGFGRADASHYEYIEEGRNPWQYRPAGSAVCPDEKSMPYPRVCAHRGFSAVAPENSMPAFGAAVALGAEEIEFDLWSTSDDEIVSIHDSNLDRVSDGTGNVWDYTYQELLKFDFGVNHGESYKGLRIAKFEEILKEFACRVIMNIHVKFWDFDFPKKYIDEIIGLIKKYKCEKYVYFMTTNDTVLKYLKKNHPEFCLCVGHDDKRPWDIVERAIEIGAQKVQLYKPFFNQEMIDKAHEHGIICNVFFSDDNEETLRYRAMGIDTILSNDYFKTARIVHSK